MGLDSRLSGLKGSTAIDLLRSPFCECCLGDQNQNVSKAKPASPAKRERVVDFDPQRRRITRSLSREYLMPELGTRSSLSRSSSTPAVIRDLMCCSTTGFMSPLRGPLTSATKLATPGHRHYIPMLVGPFTQGLSQHRNLLGEIIFLNKRVGPESSHQIVFSNDLAAVLDQHQQSVETLR